LPTLLFLCDILPNFSFFKSKNQVKNQVKIQLKKRGIMRFASKNCTRSYSQKIARAFAPIIVVLIAVLIVGLCAMPSVMFGQAQYVEDGLRYALPNNILSVRQGALGAAYAGLADDYAATLVNPAGLTLLPAAEFSAGVQFLTNNNSTTFLGNTFVRNASTFAPTHVGLVLPVRVGESGNVSFSLGYSRTSDFTRQDTLSGFNTESSLVHSWVQEQRTRDLRRNFAWRMLLADTVGGNLFTPVRNNLQQNIGVRESGDLSSVSAGFAVDVTPNFALGVSLIGSLGTYRYVRRIQEVDLQNRYNRLDGKAFTNVDFFRHSYNEFLTQQVAGLKIIIGAQGRIADNLRLGASVTLPSSFQVTEEFRQNGITRFDRGDSVAFNPTDTPDLQYSFTTPLVVNAGASVYVNGLTLTAGAEYTDVQSMTFRGSGLDAGAVNETVRQLLGVQIRAGVGAEYEFANSPLLVRGSVNYSSTPYQEEQGSQVSAQMMGAVGLGYYLAANSRLDVLYRVTQQSMTNRVYGTLTFGSIQNIHTTAIQYSVRF
jgi:long-subunit fatty acid transport protein